MVKVLDKGFVELEDFMGGDLRVVNAAKVSFHKHSIEMGEREEKLIKYLVKHRHGSVFEHTYFTFRVKAPLFVVREWQRHRIGSYNEMSGRYVEFEPEFYVPEQFRVPAENNKQGSVLYDEKTSWHKIMRAHVEATYRIEYEAYKEMLDRNVAKEMARMVLPLSLYTEFYWTVNARSLSNFCSLRSGVDAQWEIRQYSKTLEALWETEMPITYEAWIDNGSQAL